jgi:hypothetical protein
MFPRILLSAAVVVLVLSSQTRGQNAPPPANQPALTTANTQRDLFDVSLGFDYLRVPDAIVKNMYGFDLSIFVNANSWLALGGELVAGFGSTTQKVFFRNVDFDESRVAYLFGPRVKVWRRQNFNVFLEALAGGSHAHIEATIFNFRRTASADGFAAALGGGADWQFGRHWSWRLLEANYIPAHFNNQWENEWRVSSGVAYSFGAGW